MINILLLNVRDISLKFKLNLFHQSCTYITELRRVERLTGWSSSSFVTAKVHTLALLAAVTSASNNNSNTHVTHNNFMQHRLLSFTIGYMNHLYNERIYVE